jgi:hypothetical protein
MLHISELKPMKRSRSRGKERRRKVINGHLTNKFISLRDKGEKSNRAEGGNASFILFGGKSVLDRDELKRERERSIHDKETERISIKSFLSRFPSS